jgi:hypothetical protein
MSAQIEITSLTGTLPASVFVSDVYGNNETFIGTISAAIPPTDSFILPTIFNNAPAIIIKIIDSLGCEKFKVFECGNNCSFSIQIIDAGCVMIIEVISQ